MSTQGILEVSKFLNMENTFTGVSQNVKFEARMIDVLNFPPKACGRLRGKRVLAEIIVLVTSRRSPVVLGREVRRREEEREREKERERERERLNDGARWKKRWWRGMREETRLFETKSAASEKKGRGECLSLSMAGSSAQLRPSSSNLASSVEFSTSCARCRSTFSVLFTLLIAARAHESRCTDRQKL